MIFPRKIDSCVAKAYNDESFFDKEIVPLHKLDVKTYILELWHGPTAAFKDMALQILPYFLTTATKKVGADKEIVILVATSGDTGKAALEGFKMCLELRLWFLSLSGCKVRYKNCKCQLPMVRIPMLLLLKVTLMIVKLL